MAIGKSGLAVPGAEVAAEAGVAGRAAEPPASSGLHRPLDQHLLAVDGQHLL